MARFQRILVTAPAPEGVAVESDFVVILAALLCALICVVGLIAMARCAWLRRGPTQGPLSSAAANKGLKKKTLQSLPKFTLGPNFESAECAICLGEFQQGQDVRALPQCAHSFHVACIDTWLASHSSCPSCRQILALTTACKNCGRFPDAKTPPPDTKLAAAPHCNFIAVLP